MYPFAVSSPVARVRAYVVFLLLTTLLLGGCASTPAPDARADQGAPKNIIILFADGAAATQWEFGRYSSRVLRGKPFAVTDTVFRQGTLGLMSVAPADAMVTDSAAAASAMATGHKTNNDMVSVTPDGKPVRTIMEAAAGAGKRIGLVTTATIYDASPAAMASHMKSRRSSQEIVDQMVALGPDVLMGGGRDYFLPKTSAGGRRSDGRDVMAELRTKGYDVIRDPAGLRAAKGGRLLALFADEDMDYEIDRDAREQPSFAEMTSAALRALSQSSPRGFVLFIENENVDSAGHRNDAAALMRDLWAFDDAVQVALEYVRRNPDTLLIIAGDHETGGLSITYALKDLSSTSTRNRFYAKDDHLARVGRIGISLEKAAHIIGNRPSPETLDRAIAQHFPEFTLDPDLRTAMLERKPIERNVSFIGQGALGRMIARQTGFYWGTTGHTTEPVPVGAIGPGAALFRGYMDNTDFAKALFRLIGGSE